MTNTNNCSKQTLKNISFLLVTLLITTLTYSQPPDSWTPKADFGGTGRVGAVGFSIGNKGYVGTGYGYGYKIDFWAYDTELNIWTQIADYGGGVRENAVGFSIGEKGYVGTGYFFDGETSHYYKDFWEYDTELNTWTQKANFGGTSRAIAVGFSIGSKGYISTGSSYLTYHKDSWEYNPATNTWTQKADCGATGRYGAVGFSIGNKGYVGTGYYNGTFRKDFWEYDPLTNLWTQKALFGGPARSYAVGFSIGNKGYIGTGYDNSFYDGIVYKDFWEYDANMNTWIQKTNFKGTSRYAAVGFSAGNKGYIGMGQDNAGFKIDFWKYTNDCILDNIVYVDNDADGHGNPSDSAINPTCDLLNGYAYNKNDCNDVNASVHPDACDGTNGVDDNCNGVIDDGSGTSPYYADTDSDGYGSGIEIIFSCSNPGVGYSANNADCNDGYSQVHPAALELIINCIDDNCNGTIDEGLVKIWTQKTDFGGTARYGATGFSINGKGYIGTGYTTTYMNDFWEYDPASNAWIQKADFGGTARYFAVGFSIDNKGYIGTGDDGSTKKDFWEYDPLTNTWKKRANFGGSSRSLSTGFSIGSKGYIGLGSSSSINKNDFWEYDPASNTWIQRANFGGTARYGAVGFSIVDKGYVGTGYDGTYKNDFWQYDPLTDLWTQKTNFGGVARYEAVGFSTGSNGYIGTGSDGTFKKDFWEYDPAFNTWTQKVNFGGTARFRAVGFSIHNIGYIGTGFDNANKKDFWEYTPDFPICPLPLSLAVSNITVEKANISWLGNACAYSYGVRKRPVGAPDWIYSMVIAPATSKTLGNNLPATTYEVQVQTYCDSLKTDSSGYTASVNFTSASACSGVTTASTTNITNTTATLNWTYSVSPAKWTIKYKKSGTSGWITVKISGNLSSYQLTGLLANTNYDWKIQAKCGSETSDWSALQHFSTALKMAAEIHEDISFSIFPNPAKDHATVKFKLQTSSYVNISVFDAMGRETTLIVNGQLEKGEHTFQINTAQFAKGVHVVRMISDGGMINRKLVVE